MLSCRKGGAGFLFLPNFLSNGKVRDLHNIYILRNSNRNGMIESVVFVDMCQYMSMKYWMQIRSFFDADICWVMERHGYRSWRRKIIRGEIVIPAGKKDGGEESEIR